MIISVRSRNKGINPNQPTPLSVAVAASTLELDPVKLEQHYLALYGAYASHIGQGKEAAQVAMKHTISDLWKEAVAWDAILPPLPVALTVTVNTVDHDVASLQYLARRLSGMAKKSLLV